MNRYRLVQVRQNLKKIMITSFVLLPVLLWEEGRGYTCSGPHKKSQDVSIPPPPHAIQNLCYGCFFFKRAWRVSKHIIVTVSFSEWLFLFNNRCLLRSVVVFCCLCFVNLSPFFFFELKNLCQKFVCRVMSEKTSKQTTDFLARYRWRFFSFLFFFVFNSKASDHQSKEWRMAERLRRFASNVDMHRNRNTKTWSDLDSAQWKLKCISRWLGRHLNHSFFSHWLQNIKCQTKWQRMVYMQS